MRKTTKVKSAQRKKVSAQAKKSKKARSRKSSSVAMSQTNPDIIQVILKDHEPLKKLIKILKNSGRDISERRTALETFVPLLSVHAKTEEKVLYTYMKNNTDLREESFEGDVEHALADLMVEQTKVAVDEDLWSARVKVLAELVEHHIKEEESDMLPSFKKESTVQIRQDLGANYLALKPQFESGDQKIERFFADIPSPELYAP